MIDQAPIWKQESIYLLVYIISFLVNAVTVRTKNADIGEEAIDTIYL